MRDRSVVLQTAVFANPSPYSTKLASPADSVNHTTLTEEGVGVCSIGSVRKQGSENNGKNEHIANTRRKKN
jgi:hypothetical protein